MKVEELHYFKIIDIIEPNNCPNCLRFRADMRNIRELQRIGLYLQVMSWTSPGVIRTIGRLFTVIRSHAPHRIRGLPRQRANRPLHERRPFATSGYAGPAGPSQDECRPSSTLR